MAKNFVQNGMTISILNAGAEAIASGDVVLIGNIVAVAITNIAVQDSGDGFTEGVFQLPKASADVFTPGAAVYVSDGTAQASADGGVYAGIAWEDAASGSTVVNVKINAGAAPAVTESGS
ncbi:DUF2190 family protein [Pantoea phytobeneficialis]|uniref:DUF2190 family protein n=1 Tax=Pantoea phytobeneficialis TaxID=2052056 RepID=A0AAP9H4B2_9GAMM|nr:capsid cement protein [Pantoea phytobeneficialis]MDO6406261.1 DUF2190 family protein [Pantoea phytobeneficialis]QGR06244.1 recombinase RecA [Pantoea phytobeneficialis]